MHDDVRSMSTAGNNEMVYGHWVVGCRKTKGQPNACFCHQAHARVDGRPSRLATLRRQAMSEQRLFVHSCRHKPLRRIGAGSEERVLRYMKTVSMVDVQRSVRGPRIVPFIVMCACHSIGK